MTGNSSRPSSRQPKPPEGFSLRRARTDEAKALTGLAMRSKAHWGYDNSFMAQCVASLTIAHDEIEAGLVVVIVDAEDVPVGHAAIAMTDATTADVAAMFVEPAMIGHGLGRPLFEAGLAIARQQGATRLTILSDPQARGFYERMGACYIEDRPSDAIPGRTLPWLVLEI